MRRSNRSVSLALLGLGGAVAVFGLALFWPQLSSRVGTAKNNTNDQAVRQEYADLYQAAWRQDDGRGSILVTATLFTPRLRQLLAEEKGLSSDESQINRLVSVTASGDIPVFLTLDSVTGDIPDDTVKNALALTADGLAFTLQDWHPIVSTSRVVNTNAPVTSQSGVATFRAAKTFGWENLKGLKLIVRGIGDTPVRTFLWAEPSLLR